MSKRFCIPLLWAASAVFLSSCGQPEQRSSVGYPEVLEVSREVAQLRYPVEESNISINQQYAIYFAEDILMERCTKEKGVEWTLIEPPKQFISANRRRYGVMELKVARRYGYHLPPSPEEAVVRMRRLNQLTSREDRVSFGTNGEGGCYGEARKRMLDGTPDVDYKLFNELNGKSVSIAQRSGSVKKVIANWRSCMNDSQFEYKDPFDAAGDPSWSRSKVPSGKEIEAATVDVKCKEKSDLIAVWAREEVKLQARYIRENEEYFKRLRAAKESQMRITKKITGMSVVR